MQYAYELCAWCPGGEGGRLFFVWVEGGEVFECGWRSEEDAFGFDSVECVVCALYRELDAVGRVFCGLDGAGEEDIRLQELKSSFVQKAVILTDGAE